MAYDSCRATYSFRILFAAIAAAGFLAAGVVNAQGLIYQDADDGFIGAANLSNLDDITDFDFFVNDDLWAPRPSGPDTADGFGADGTVFVAGDGRSDAITEPMNAEDVPVITQTLTGLTPNTNFDVYVVYWSATNADWSIRAGSSSVNGANQLFNRTGSDINGASATAGLAAASAVWDQLPQANSTPGVFEEGNRVMLLGNTGSMMSNGSGQLSVFVDDLSDETTIGSRTWFDGIAVIPAGQDAFVQATIDRGTGDIDFTFNNTAGLDIVSYAVVSLAGGLDPANWNSIAEGSNGSFDTDSWTEGVSTDTELFEFEDAPATDGFNLNGTFSVGDVWRASPYEDVVITLNLSDSSAVTVRPTYSGPEVTFGSFDGDADIDTGDFAILMSNMFGSASTTAVESYFLGDVTGDLVVDFEDFVAFEELYDAANGPGAFAALSGTQIPEPSSIAVLTSFLLFLGIVWRKSRTAVTAYESSPSQFSLLEYLPMISPRRLAVATAIIALFTLSSSSQAVLVGSYDFTGGSLADGSGNGNDAFESEGANSGSGNTFADAGGGFVIDPIRGDVFDLTGGGDGGSKGGLNLTLPVAGNNTGAWSLAMWALSPEGTRGYLFDNRHTAAGTTSGTDQLIINLGGQSNENSVSVYNGAAWLNTGTPQRIDDGTWHHVAWVYDGTELTGYIDGVAGSAPEIATISRDLLLQGIELGNEGIGGGFGGQEGRLIDDVMVYNNALTAQEVADLAVPLTLDLVVDTTDGTVSIQNNQSFDFDFKFYQVNSGTDETPGTSLNTVGWVSLDDQEGADPPGTGWVEAGESNSRRVAEGNVTGSELLSPGSTLELGVLFDTSIGVEDLSFNFTLANGTTLQSGLVDYVVDDGIAPPSGGDVDGDYNGDGVVNIADYTVWRDNLGSSDDSVLSGNGDSTPGVGPSDYTFWKTNFGMGSPASLVGSPVNVPEPTALTLFALGLAGISYQRIRNN